MTILDDILLDILKAHGEWTRRWAPYEADATTLVPEHSLRKALDELASRLDDNYPFFHPSYAGQMLKPPHPAAIAGYLSAMLINPNNHALDGGPATAGLEKEVIRDLASMLGYSEHLGHLTSSGTIANLEALWVCRQLHPDSAIAFSDQSHYTHARMCEVLGIRGIAVPSLPGGGMDPEVLRRLCREEAIGAVVATIGTTGIGALDPLAELVELRREFGFRLHADAAYGGFFRLIADDSPDGVASSIYARLPECDSIVIDPHKHGLQPYGCGCVLFRDPSIGVLYSHDSPYTYFSSSELHLGEISLECSRAGASAAALWTTLRVLPLSSTTGLGSVLRKCRAAAIDFANLITASEHLTLVQTPELDITAYFSIGDDPRTSSISARSTALFRRTMADPEAPVYLSTFRIPSSRLLALHPTLEADSPECIVLRSVLMKPEHRDFAPTLLSRIESHCDAL